MVASRSPSVYAGAYRIVIVVAATLIAALAPITNAADEFSGDGTFYGDDQWAGSCAGNVGPPWHSGVWPPAGASYTTSMIPGSAVALNVALNSRQYSTDMCGKLLYVRVTNSGCTRCGTTQMPEGYMLARVTNECPECLFGSLDFGMKGDGRWRIEWHWADGQVSTESATPAVQATIPSKFKLNPTSSSTSSSQGSATQKSAKKHKHHSGSGTVKKHKHSAKFYADQAARLLRAQKRAEAAAAKAALANGAAGKSGRKLLAV